MNTRSGGSCYRYLTLRHNSSFLKGSRSFIHGVQFSRVLKSTNLSHILLGSHNDQSFRHLDHLLDQVPSSPHPEKAYQTILSRCKSLTELKRVHAHILHSKANSSVFISNLLVQAYARCGSIHLATQVFSSTINRNQHSWSILITACVRSGLYMQALELYKKMSCECEPNQFILSAALRACAQLGEIDEGREIHRQLLKSGQCLDVVVQNALVTMYAKCGDLRTARGIFDGIKEKNLVTWNAMISSYVQNGEAREALSLYSSMQERGNSFILASVLTACSMVQDLELGKKIHGELTETDVIVQNALMNMYAKCGELKMAREIFEEMPKRDVCAWTALISGYAQHGHSDQAVEVYERMRRESVQPNAVTFAVVMAACENLEKVETVAEDAAACGCSADSLVQTALLGTYGKFGRVEEARALFESIADKDVVCWSSMIAAYAHNGFSSEALQLFRKMVSEGVEPNSITLTSVFSACGAAEDLEEGRAIHTHLSSYTLSSGVQNTLVRMYCRCASLEEARQVFEQTQHREMLTWGMMITACVQHGFAAEALELYHQMDVEPDEFVFAGAAGACSALGDLEEGKAVHARASPRELSYDVLGTALLDMYVKCDLLDEAWNLFRKLDRKNVYAWTVMIGAHAHKGDSAEALNLFRSMELEGIEPNSVTFASVLPALNSPADLRSGQELHARLDRTGEAFPDRVVTALIVMYNRCGSMNDAREVFEQKQPQEVFAWNALISGYNQHCLYQEALELYRRMVAEDDGKPNGHTFAMALNACSCLGDVEEGRRIHLLTDTRGIKVDFVLNALVTMYSRCGRMDEALDVFEKITDRNVVSWTAMISSYVNNGYPKEALAVYLRMDTEPDDITFVCVLNACATVGSLEDGKAVHARIVSKDIKSNYVNTAVANMYAKCGAMVEARMVFDKMLRSDTISWNAMMTAYAQHGKHKQVLELYSEMVQAGVDPNGVTFISILVSCGHAEAALFHFQQMVSEHFIPPMPDHYQCVTDVLARTGHLADAEKFIQQNKTTSTTSPVAWLALLSACRDQGDADRGKRAAQHVFTLDPVDTAPYILLSNIYAQGKAGRSL